ncbi:MAG: bacteriohemerythrin [Candidatus Sulfotelmatobacter sp.]|jgi:hemerythrin-like metal-binding protein
MPTSKTTFRWTRAHSVNIEFLDRQHERLFDTVNELHQALRSGRGNSAIYPVLVHLVDYARQHFEAEELLMEKHGFRGLPAHKAEHAMFRRKLAAFLRAHKSGKAGVPVSLIFFMQTWLKEHILTVDQQYSSFLNERGVR